MDLNHRWSLFKEKIQQELEPEEFEAWLDDLALVEISSKKTIIAGISHPMFRDDIAKNHDHLFRSLLTELFPEYAPFHKKKVKYRVGVHHFVQQDSIQTEFAFDDASNDLSTASEGFPDASGSFPEKNQEVLDESQKIIPLKTASFEAKHCLNSLVIGSHNQLAYEAGCRIIHESGILYNPLFIYGGIGLGKTHLLEAIGQAFSQLHPTANIVYTTGEGFLNDFLVHLNQKKMDVFRQRYRLTDLLLIRNVQTISGARSQEELLHTIDALLKRKKQIVVTCNQLPSNIDNLNEMLCSRLQSGLVTDIGVPDLEMRMAILQSRAKQDHILLPPEVCYYIAKHIYSNVSKMVGALIRLGAYASLLRQKISLDFAKSRLVDLLETTHLTEFSSDAMPDDKAEAILQKICTMSQVSRSDLQSAGRANKVVRARQMGMYLLRELTDMKLSEIGKQFGNRTHSAIHNSLKQVEKKMETDDLLRQQILSLKDDLSEKKFVNPSEIPRLISEAN
ncbi:MAG: chromosomal replication initiator protein DnaA [SAR324 cluster bacterium]|nr:chromosomal replication initiator protein DnaA [SAR324 cluster bacterium]